MAVDPLEPEAQKMIALFRATHPGAATRERNLEQVRARLRRDAPRPEPVPPAAQPRPAQRTWVVAATVGLALAAAAVLWLATRAPDHESVESAPGPHDEAVRVAPPPTLNGSNAREPTKERPVPRPDDPVDDPVAEPSPEARARPAPARSRETAKAKPEADPLRAEAELMGRVRKALHGGRLGEAERLLDRHATEHPEGALVPEREGYRVIVGCKDGRPGAGSSATSFERRHPGSPLQAQIRAACKGVQEQ